MSTNIVLKHGMRYETAMQNFFIIKKILRAIAQETLVKEEMKKISCSLTSRRTSTHFQAEKANMKSLSPTSVHMNKLGLH